MKISYSLCCPWLLFFGISYLNGKDIIDFCIYRKPICVFWKCSSVEVEEDGMIFYSNRRENVEFFTDLNICLVSL